MTDHDTQHPPPIIGVGAVIFKGDAVLLIRRGKPPADGAWSLPGGRQERGETVRATAAREVMEETGVSAEITDLIDVVDYIERTPTGDVAAQYTLVDFLGVWRAGAPVAGDDARDVRWVPLADLDSLPLWSETRRVIVKGAALAGLPPAQGRPPHEETV